MEIEKYNVRFIGGPHDGREVVGIVGHIGVPDYSPGDRKDGWIEAVYTPGTTEIIRNPNL